jgi:hypothetical protein
MDKASNNAGKTRGKPFQRGNTFGRGRGAGSRNKATIAIERLLEGEAETITRKCVELAKGGDTTAMRLCMERIYPVRKGRPVMIALPDIKVADDLAIAMSAVVSAMSLGDISPDEAVTIAGVLEVKRKAIETVELERRIAAIEARETSASGTGADR